MNKLFLLVALILPLQIAALQHASAAAVSKRFPSDIDGVDLILSCEPGPIASDYAAETASGVSLTDPYAVARGADKGLVYLMNEGGRQAKQYIIPHQVIRAVVKIKYGMDVLDRVDLIFTSSHLALVHTYATNAGIFTISNVYELPLSRSGGVDREPFEGDRELLHLLDLGLSFYQPAKAKCNVIPMGLSKP